VFEAGYILVAVSHPLLARELQEFAEGRPLTGWKAAAKISANASLKNHR
jgi:hypothetical protein